MRPTDGKPVGHWKREERAGFAQHGVDQGGRDAMIFDGEKAFVQAGPANLSREAEADRPIG
jgi:hypothetical protein